MTRQLFPSPSQGALICAGGEEEGRLAAAPASARARRQDPTPHFWLLDSRLRAFLGGFWALLGDPVPADGAEPAEGAGLPPAGPRNCTRTGRGSSAVRWRPRSSRRPRPACDRIAAAGGRLSEEREGGRFPSRRLGSLAGVPAVELVCSLLFLTRGPRTPSLSGALIRF